MPKLKTHRGAAKRFIKTASGRVKMRAATRNHILTKRTQKSKRQARQRTHLSAPDTVLAIRLLHGS
jgi:large subunit ribosomal protein L35